MRITIIAGSAVVFSLTKPTFQQVKVRVAASVTNNEGMEDNSLSD
jgi:hypothetical protein